MRSILKSNWFIAIAAALILSSLYFIVATRDMMNKEHLARTEAARINESFTASYARVKSAGGAIPSTYRRLALEHFEANYLVTDNQGSDTAIRVVGLPGAELYTFERDPEVLNILESMSKPANFAPVVRHQVKDNRLLGRTIVPIEADHQTCVDCHNTSLEENIYQVGDIMGFYVFVSDLSSLVGDIFVQSLLVFAIAVSGTMLIVKRERGRLATTVKALERQINAEKESRKAEAYANFLGSHDALTGLANRRLFMDKLAAHITALQKKEISNVLMVLVDLDDFKLVNDTFGHEAGDAYLMAVGNRLQEAVARCNGFAARLGGDEFAAVVPCSGCCDQSAEGLGAELIEAICQPVFYHKSEITSSASIGIAPLDLIETLDQSTPMRAADMALYTAKRAGKGRYQVFNKYLEAIMGRRSAMLDALVKAIEEGSLDVALQPQVNLATQRVVSFEALARWTWNGHKINPEEFIPLAEEAGIIQQLDMLVLTKAAHVVGKINAEFDRSIKLSTNLSALNFGRKDMVERVLKTLKDAQFPPEKVMLEITESALLENWNDSVESLKALQKRGIEIALDDFGTGYSSLSYLTKVPFNCVKVDKSFIDTLNRDSDQKQVLIHIISLAKNLGKCVVIEGVETSAQLELLVEMGASVGQGFFFAGGLRPDECWTFLEQQGQNTALPPTPLEPLRLLTAQ